MKPFKQWIGKLLCQLLGHKGWIGERGKPIKCKRCGKPWMLT
jgi:hypothetical protein